MAAVTVQELLYTTVIVAVAIPGALAYAAGISGIAVSLAGILAIIGILTIDPVFSAVLRVVGLIPWARRARRQLEVLHEQVGPADAASPDLAVADPQRARCAL